MTSVFKILLSIRQRPDFSSYIQDTICCRFPWKKGELREIINEKFSNLKKEFSEADSAVHRAHKEVKEHAAEAARKAREVGEEKVREVTHRVDKSVEQHPWLYVAGGALGGLLLGYILGRKD